MALAYRPYRLAKIIDEAEGIRTFVCEPSDGQGVPPYKPGQFFNLRLTTLPPGFKPNFHSYSASRTWTPEAVRFGIKMHGPFTQHLFTLKEGTPVEVMGPFGIFGLPEKIDSPIVFLAAGIGITPLLCMAEHLAKSGHTRPFFLFYSNRNKIDIAYDALLHQLADINSNFKMVHTLTCADMPDGWTGECGRMDVGMLKRNGVDLDAAHFYFCGPKGFIDAMMEQLGEAGVPKERLHKEVW
ncbi:MAG: hypothetical protein KGH63_00265 [Candidatus Micrarchaeota archaeon]|nr:hypothetical protein [Candidatus Micrarchaeota archaeon]